MALESPSETNRRPAGSVEGPALVVAAADTADRDGVVGLIGQAGGTVTGLVELTDAVGDPARADQLRELTSQLLPVGAQLAGLWRKRERRVVARHNIAIGGKARRLLFRALAAHETGAKAIP